MVLPMWIGYMAAPLLNPVSDNVLKYVFICSFYMNILLFAYRVLTKYFRFNTVLSLECPSMAELFWERKKKASGYDKYF